MNDHCSTLASISRKVAHINHELGAISMELKLLAMSRSTTARGGILASSSCMLTFLNPPNNNSGPSSSGTSDTWVELALSSSKKSFSSPIYNYH